MSFTAFEKNIVSNVYLDFVFPLCLIAEGSEDHAVLVKSGHEVIPLGHRNDLLVAASLGAAEHVGLDIHQEGGDLRPDALLRKVKLIARIAADNAALVVGNVAGANLNAQRDSLLLPVIEFPTGSVVLLEMQNKRKTRSYNNQNINKPHRSIIKINTNSLSLEELLELRGIGRERLGVRVLHHDGHDDDLHRGHSRGEHEALVVAMHHHAHADAASGKTP